jgi:signal transduction histidine kinase
MPSDGASFSPVDAGRDLSAINRWLCVTRLRAVLAVAVFTALIEAFRPHVLHLAPVLAVSGALALCSIAGLWWPGAERRPWLVFTLQHVADMAGITVGIALAATGTTALIFHLLYVLVIIPASLLSVLSGLAVATAATFAHVLLLVLERGATANTVLSLESLAFGFLFFLVAQQCFFYGGHLKQKNAALAELAAGLEDSRQRLAALVQVARTLNSTLEAPELLARITRAALDQLAAGWAATFLIEPSRGTFHLAALSDADVTDTELARVEFPLAAWPVLQRLSRERVVVLTGAQAERTTPLFTGDLRLRTLYLAGLYGGGDLVGFLALGYAADAAPDYEHVLSQLGAIGEHAAIALRNAKLLDEARQASALKSEFVSTVSHELRTPLNVIIGYTDMLRDGAADPLSGKQLDLLLRVDACARELLELIEATLHVGRIETGREGVALAPLSVPELVDALEASVAGLPRPPGVALEWECPATAAGAIVTDRAKVGLIVRNLVSNAFKFTPAGRVVVRVVPREASLSIEVADTGIGIPPEQVPLAFEMFRQLNAAPTRRYGGVGLGLYIVKQFVLRLGGSVEVQSTPGVGSTFRVTIPRAAPAAAAGPPSDDARPGSTHAPQAA